MQKTLAVPFAKQETTETFCVLDKSIIIIDVHRVSFSFSVGLQGNSNF